MPNPQHSLDIVTIDGPAGSGKSTLAKKVAAHLGWGYLDSGALYRAIAWSLLQVNCPPLSGPQLEQALATLRFRIEREGEGWVPYLGEADLRPVLRLPEVGEAASRFSALPEVRAYLLGVQHEAGEQGKLVCDGRDMGSVVFPQAKHKFFLDASPEVRAKRRYLELCTSGHAANYDAVRDEQSKRDARDQARTHAPLIRPKGAIVVDTSDKSVAEVLKILLNFIDKATSPGY